MWRRPYKRWWARGNITNRWYGTVWWGWILLYCRKEEKIPKDIWKQIEHAEDKIRERQEKGNAIARENRRKQNIVKSQNKTRITNPIPPVFASPNKKDFGHFKKIDFNKNGPVKFDLKFKKPFK